MGPLTGRGSKRQVGRKIRILLLIKGLGRGGAEKILVDLLANRDRENFEYEVAFVLKQEDALVPEIQATGTPVHSLGAKGDWDLTWMLWLRRLLTRQRFDVVHAHLPYSAGLGRLVAFSLGHSARPRFVYTEHSIWGRTASPVRWVNAAAIRHDDALVTVAESSRDALPGSLRSKALVLVHGVDLSMAAGLVERRKELREEVRAELGIPDTDCMALTVANLRAEKGYDVLLEAARIAKERGLAACFVSAGRGPLEDELEAEHRRLGLGDGFKFLGPREDALRLMVAADMLVLPSHHEGLPVTIMEATSVGIPIVATKVGEIPRMFTDGTDALLVEPGDPRALEEAVGRLVVDPDLRMKLAEASMKLSSRFDVSYAARFLEKLYVEIVDGHNS
jgi:glycosyltransferase involved in cell wall biosynthesis